MNPNGTVPTIDDDGFILWDSNAILLWLALKRGSDVLSGGDPQHLARALQWMSWTNENLEPILHTLVMELVRLPKSERDPAKLDEACIAISRPLDMLNAQLARQPFVAGDRFTIGDIPAGAAIRRWLVLIAHDTMCHTLWLGRTVSASAKVSRPTSLPPNFISVADFGRTPINCSTALVGEASSNAGI
jgi:glutathione S-transferase